MNGPIDLQTYFQIPYILQITNGITIPIDVLPKQLIDGRVMIGKTERCLIKYGQQINRGSYGNIIKINRTPTTIKELCVKTPHKTEYSLISEAILQWFASETLRSAGIYGAIPQIYDIFQYAGETRFSMDYIKGMSAVEAVNTSEHLDTTWLQILAQVSLILGYLEEHIRLDHRDLKADNIWIHKRPIEYSILVGGKKWTIKNPFQVVLLDFGFACLGNEEGNAIVSLSDGILPKIDPCPKEGRDLFQFIASMWSLYSIRTRASSALNEFMKTLLVCGGSSYVELVTSGIQTHWIYLAVSDRRFSHPPLHPVSLLLKLSSHWKESGLQQE
jgi:serine/threonine protein kinase